MAYIDKENNLQTTLYFNRTDQPSHLHDESEHPNTLRNSIAYSQTLRFKTICSAEVKF